ncbi:MAG: 30S ribosome-binding factor RbfA [Bacteroidota bacterium]
MAASIRTQRVARLLQKTLGDILLHEAPRLLQSTLVTVTEVDISADLGTAKVYLSTVLPSDQAVLLDQMTQHQSTIRKLLGQRLGNKLRKVPALRFYLDDAVTQAARIDHILSEINLPQG